MLTRVFAAALAVFVFVVFSTAVMALTADVVRPLTPPIVLAALSGSTRAMHSFTLNDLPAQLVFEAGSVSARPPGSKLVIRSSGSLTEFESYDLPAWREGAIVLSRPLFTPSIDVVVDGVPTGSAGVKIVALTSTPKESTPQGFVPSWRPVADPPPNPMVDRLRGAIVFLSLPGVYHPSPKCSGFLYGDAETVVTNRHCLNESQDYSRLSDPKTGKGPCTDIKIGFGYITEAGPLPLPKARCVSAFTNRTGPDLAVLRIAYEDAGQKPSVVLTASHTALTNGDDLFVIHHPSGLPMVFSLCPYQVRDTPQGSNTDYFRHRCATLGGSSGSPVLNASGALVGVHYFYEGDAWTTHGALTQRVAEGNPLLNRAVQIQELQKFLQRWRQQQ
jgi:hypothetical protein